MNGNYIDLIFRISKSNYLYKLKIFNTIYNLDDLPDYKINDDNKYIWLLLSFKTASEKDKFFIKLKDENIDLISRF